MENWRHNNIANKLVEYLVTNHNRIKYHDQDVLNAVLYDKTYHLMPMWNMTSLVYSYFLVLRGDKKDGKVINAYIKEKQNVAQYKNNPIIVHYVSKPKPWQNGCVHPLSSLYYEYARMTIVFNQIKQESPISLLINRIKYWVRCHLSFLKQLFIHTDRTRL